MNSSQVELPSAESSRPTGVRWAIFGLGCGTSWFLYLHRYMFGVMKPKLADEWGLQEDALGWLDFAFSITYTLGQVPAGIVADIIGAHLFLSITIFGWSLALAMHAAAPDFAWLVPVRVLFGAAQAGCYPVLSKMSKTWFPATVRTSLQGWIASFFGRMGGAMSNLIFASLLIGYFTMNWHVATYVLAGGGVLFGLLFTATYHNAPREHPRCNAAEVRLIEGECRTASQGRPEIVVAERTASQGRPAGESVSAANATGRMSFREMRSRMSRRSVRNFSAFLFQQFTSTFPDMIYSAWVPFFLQKVHHLSDFDTGICASLPLFGGACGGIVGGYLNDYLIRKIGRRWGRSLVGFSGKITASLMVVAALFFYNQPYTFCILLFFVKFFADWSQPTVWGTVTDVGGPATATVFGINNMIGGFGGNASSIVFGYIAKLLGWLPVFVVAGASYVLSSIAWLFVDCTIPLMREEES